MCSTDIFLGLLALLFPPLPVWVKRGICSADSIINILLCMLGYLPGLIHAWYIIAKFPEPDYDYRPAPYDNDTEGGRVYVYVNEGDRRRPAQLHQQQYRPNPSHDNNGMSYGTTGAAPAPAPAQNQNNAVEGSSANPNIPPPTYAQVIAGDNKIQSQD